MSRAFVKEDVDLPERTGARRSPAGLPPGAVNYMTEEGAGALRRRLEVLTQAGGDAEERQRLEQTLATAVTVPPPATADAAVFGSTVTLVNGEGETRTLRIVGADETGFAPENVSWVSPVGKALLGAALNQRLKLPPDDRMLWRVAAIG
jgi:transcription elongation GreA/GreB family factor